MTQFPHDLKKQNEIKYIKYWNYYDKYAWKRFLYKKKLIWTKFLAFTSDAQSRDILKHKYLKI